jgi:hypothetical protein
VKALALLVAASVALTGCRSSVQSAYDAWGVPSSGVPEHEFSVIGSEDRDGLFSAQIPDPGWTEEQVKQVAASVIEGRRDRHSAVVLRFVSDTGERIAAFARDAGGANHLRSAGFDPAEVQSSGFPFLGFSRTGPPQEQPVE